MTIEDCFQKLLKKIEPREADAKAYKKHRKSITSRLKKAFSAHRVELIGSFKRDTAICGTSDIDLMLILSSQEVARGDDWKSSKSVLNRIRDELQGRYWNTVVGVDKQAVVAQFKGNKHPVDVVPAIYQGLDKENKYAIYAIPDGEGGWMLTSPQAHNKFIALEDRRSKEKLKQTAKLLKYWRECRTPSIPLSTFHLELLLAKERTCSGKMAIATCVKKALLLLRRRQCRTLTDPVGISNYIGAASTKHKLERVRQAINSSAIRADKACQAERKGNLKEALRLWHLVFNKSLPKVKLIKINKDESFKEVTFTNGLLLTGQNCYIKC